MGQSDTTFRHHLDEVTEAQFKCDVPSHTQSDDLLVKVPSLEQILCRGRFRHPGSYRRIPGFSTFCTRTPTGINGLSPRSPVLRGLDTLPIHAPYNTIVGDRGRGDTPNSSDGVVAYWSSHLAGAQSELIVPGPHGSYALPQTVSELKRILRLNLGAVSAPPRNTMPE